MWLTLHLLLWDYGDTRAGEEFTVAGLVNFFTDPDVAVPNVYLTESYDLTALFYWVWSKASYKHCIGKPQTPFYCRHCRRYSTEKKKNKVLEEEKRRNRHQVVHQLNNCFKY